jgi:hypothetical protein
MYRHVTSSARDRVSQCIIDYRHYLRFFPREPFVIINVTSCTNTEHYMDRFRAFNVAFFFTEASPFISLPLAAVLSGEPEKST